MLRKKPSSLHQVAYHMHVFLTGATGYIGVAVAERLRKAGHRLSGLARGDAAAERLQAAAVQPVRGDFADAVTVGAARAADATISMATSSAQYADALALDQQASGTRARKMLGWHPHGPDPLEDLERGSYVSLARRAVS
jgi:uncharacterized protein YbjT (DUF2867 family)